MKTKINKLKPLCFIILISLLATSCNSNKEENKNEAVAEYKVVTVSPEDISLYREFPVKIEGIENIEIPPKVEGFIEKVLVDEGEYVKKGQLLFILNALLTLILGQLSSS